MLYKLRINPWNKLDYTTTSQLTVSESIWQISYEDYHGVIFKQQGSPTNCGSIMN